MRTIPVRHKSTGTLLEMFEFDGRNPEQVTALAKRGYVCYSTCLLMDAYIWDSTTAINGEWAFLSGDQAVFITDVDRLFEPPFTKYGGDSRTIKQVWEDSNGT